jgi:hypothetical protein
MPERRVGGAPTLIDLDDVLGLGLSGEKNECHGSE